MIGLDTNILVRYLTQDDPRQAATAVKAIEETKARGEKILLQPLILCELIWVLEDAYRYPKNEIVSVLEQILRTAQFVISHKDRVWRAFDEYRRGKADFSDYYLGRANEEDGAEITLSFDAALKDNPRFRVFS